MEKPPKRSGRSGQVRISRIATFANWCITTVTAIIALAFVSLAVKDIPIGVLSDANPNYIQIAILSVYISCWAYGTSIDTRVQSGIYADDPEGGRVRIGAIVAVAVLAANLRDIASGAVKRIAVRSGVGWIYDNRRHGLAVSTVFSAAKDHRSKSEEVRERERLLRTIILEKVTSQVIGNWKWHRQIALTAIVLAMVVIALYPQLHDVISKYVNRLVPALPAGTIKALLPDALLLAFVLVSELWHLAFRLDTFLTIRILNDMEERFTLVPNEV